MLSFAECMQYTLSRFALDQPNARAALQTAEFVAQLSRKERPGILLEKGCVIYYESKVPAELLF